LDVTVVPKLCVKHWVLVSCSLGVLHCL